RDIHQLIVQAIQEGMLAYQGRLQSTFFTPQAGTGPERTPIHRETAPPISSAKPQGTRTFPPPQPRMPQPTTAEPQPVHLPPQQTVASPQSVFPQGVAKGHELKVVGCYNKLYIFCQSANGLVVIDQHAAHERLLFEKLKTQFLKGTINRQNLLFPESVELSLADVQKVEQYGDELDKMGFSVREFGGNAYVISAVPALGSNLPPTQLFLDVLEQFGGPENKQGEGSMLEDILASMACKAAVKAGDALSPPEMEALLEKMARADLFSHCPHGRPVLKSFSDDEIKKWFHRG
ncbi:MAG: hypothetical protein ABFR63_11905, partial [Thermodesulfobacteriota bacterium]